MKPSRWKAKTPDVLRTNTKKGRKAVSSSGGRPAEGCKASGIHSLGHLLSLRPAGPLALRPPAGSFTARGSACFLLGHDAWTTRLLLGRTAYESDRDDESLDGMLTRLSIVANDFAEVVTRVDREKTADALGWKSQARGWGWDDGGSYGRPVAD